MPWMPERSKGGSEEGEGADTAGPGGPGTVLGQSPASGAPFTTC